MGCLPALSLNPMCNMKENVKGWAFTFRGVAWRLALIVVLFFADMATQAWWNLSRKSALQDPWWAGILGWSSYGDGAEAFIASLFGMPLVIAAALFSITLFIPKLIWLDALCVFFAAIIGMLLI